MCGASRQGKRGFRNLQAENIDTNASFLEMLDVVNENLTRAGKEPIAFEHDCREEFADLVEH